MSGKKTGTGTMFHYNFLTVLYVYSLHFAFKTTAIFDRSGLDDSHLTPAPFNSYLEEVGWAEAT
jgi:hypothetical protein